MIVALLLCVAFALLWTLALYGDPDDDGYMPADRRANDRRREVRR